MAEETIVVMAAHSSGNCMDEAATNTYVKTDGLTFMEIMYIAVPVAVVALVVTLASYS